MKIIVTEVFDHLPEGPTNSPSFQYFCKAFIIPALIISYLSPTTRCRSKYFSISEFYFDSFIFVI